MDFGSGIISVFTVHFYESWQHPATHQLKSLSSKLTVVILVSLRHHLPAARTNGPRWGFFMAVVFVISSYPFILKFSTFFFLLFHNPSVFDDQIKLNTALPNCPFPYILKILYPFSQCFGLVYFGFIVERKWIEFSKLLSKPKPSWILQLWINFLIGNSHCIILIPIGSNGPYPQLTFWRKSFCDPSG